MQIHLLQHSLDFRYPQKIVEDLNGFWKLESCRFRFLVLIWVILTNHCHQSIIQQNIGSKQSFKKRLAKKEKKCLFPFYYDIF